MIYVPIAIFAAVVLVLAGLSLMGRRPPKTGLVDGRLRPCPGTPNCVSSDVEGGHSAWIRPFAFEGSPEAAWQRLAQAVEAIGGTIRADTGDYLWATFTSRIFRFVDDVELRMDGEDRVIHVRSESRVGYSDLGVNRKRVERLRGAFE